MGRVALSPTMYSPLSPSYGPSFMIITRLAPLDTCAVDSALQRFEFFLLTPISFPLFFLTFLLPSPLLGASSVFESLLLLLALISTVTGTWQGSERC